MGIDLITLQDDIPYSVLCDKLKFNFDRLIKEYISLKGEWYGRKIDNKISRNFSERSRCF